VERDIAEDPSHVHWRRPLDDGCVIDYAAADDGLLVRFRARSPDGVDLLELIDIRQQREL